MMSTLVSLSLLLVAVLCVKEDQEITPKCDDTIIKKIEKYYKEHDYPSSMAAKGIKKWTFIKYSLPIDSSICVKQEMGEGKVTSTLLNTQTKEVVLKSVVTFEGVVEKGLIKQTVQDTGENIHLYIIKNTEDVNVFYLCDPDSKDTTTYPQGGVAIPIGKQEDLNIINEANSMNKVLAKIGVATFDITPCKE